MSSPDRPPATSSVAPRAFTGVDRLHGPGSYARLANASVIVIGVGGVGSWAAEAFARHGIGKITLVDLDHVAESNINRQLQALNPTLGMPKVNALAQRINAINPHCDVTQIENFVTPENASNVLHARHDAVLDCTDQTSAKVALALHARRHGLTLFMAGAAGGRTDPTRIRRGDLRDAQGDALLRRVRELLKKSGEADWPGKDGFGITAVYSSEPMRRPVNEACDADPAAAPQGLNCVGYGSSVCVTGGFGFALAAAAIDHLLRR